MPVLAKQSEANTSESDNLILDRSWYFLFFVVSGFCGLVYEVVWLRLAMASFGVTTALVSAALASTSATVASAEPLNTLFGGLFGQRPAQQVSAAYSQPPATSAYAYAYAPALQLKLGRILLQHVGTFGAWQSSRYYLLTGLWISLTLVPWCTCMGATFPLLMAVIRHSTGIRS